MGLSICCVLQICRAAPSITSSKHGHFQIRMQTSKAGSTTCLVSTEDDMDTDGLTCNSAKKAF